MYCRKCKLLSYLQVALRTLSALIFVFLFFLFFFNIMAKANQKHQGSDSLSLLLNNLWNTICICSAPGVCGSAWLMCRFKGSKMRPKHTGRRPSTGRLCCCMFICSLIYFRKEQPSVYSQLICNRIFNQSVCKGFHICDVCIYNFVFDIHCHTL